MLIVNISRRVFVVRRGDGVGSRETRRSESIGAMPQRVFGSTLPPNLSG